MRKVALVVVVAACGAAPAVPPAAATQAPAPPGSAWHVLYASPVWIPTSAYLANDNIQAMLCHREVDQHECPDDPAIASLALDGSRVVVEVADQRFFVDSKRPHDLLISDDLAVTVRRFALDPHWGLLAGIVLTRGRIVVFERHPGEPVGYHAHAIDPASGKPVLAAGTDLVADPDPFLTGDGAMISVGWATAAAIRSRRFTPTPATSIASIWRAAATPAGGAVPNEPGGSGRQSRGVVPHPRRRDVSTPTGPGVNGQVCTLVARSRAASSTRAAPRRRRPGTSEVGSADVVEAKALAPARHAGRRATRRARRARRRADALDERHAFAIVRPAEHPDVRRPEQWRTVFVAGVVPATLE